LAESLERRKPTIHFANSMWELFHEKVSFSYVERAFDAIKQAPRHKDRR